MVPSATHRTILLMDVEKFSDHGRTDSQRRRMHSGLYDLLQDAFEAAGIGWDSCYREDRGDGAMILAPADIPKARFSDQLPYRLARTLRDYNRMHPAGEHIRLRMALHAGEVILDGRGAVSSAVNTAFRLLEAAPLKEALRNAAGRPLALIVSSWFYFEVIRNSAEFCPAAYSPVSADVKETSTIAWITIPGPRGPVRRRARSEPWRVRVRDPGGAIHGPGILVAGRYVITAAGTLGSPQPAAACPPGRVLFDVPAKPAAGLQRAETIFWCPASPSGGTPGLGVAGLSIAGPAIRGVDEPPLLFNLGLGARIVRLHAGASAGAVQGKLPLWARLPERGGNGGELIPLSPLAAEAPDVTRVCNGSDVVDEQTGEVLGLAVTDAPDAGEGRAWLTPIGADMVVRARPGGAH